MVALLAGTAIRDTAINAGVGGSWQTANLMILLINIDASAPEITLSFDQAKCEASGSKTLAEQSVAT